MAIESGATEKARTIEDSVRELRDFLCKMKGEIGAFLQQPENKKVESVPTPLNNPLDSIMDNLENARGIAGDIHGLLSEIFRRIR